MPYQTKIAYLFIFIIVFFYACDFHQSTASEILEEAESLIGQYPDSALQLLEGEIQTKNLNRELYYRYILLSVRAKDKSDRNIASDTLVFRAKDYFLGNKDTKDMMLACYYSGRVFESQNNREQAMLAYLDAEIYARQSKNDELKGLVEYSIGNLYFDQLLKDEALTRLKQASVYFNRSGEYKNTIAAYNKIGTCFILKQNIDSSFFYFDKSLSLAKANNDSVKQAFILQNIGVALGRVENWERARLYFRRAIPFFKEGEDKAKMYLNMAYSFNNEGIRFKDSTLFYINKSLDVLKEHEGSSLKSVAYQLLAKIEERDNNYQQALAYNKEYSKLLYKILEERNNQTILDVHKKYDFEVIQNDNNRLLIEKQSATLIILVLILLILILSFIFYRKNVRNKEALSDAESKIYQLKDMADSFDEKEDSFKKVLFEHFDILKKVALLEGHLKEDERKQGQRLLKKFNEIVYKQETLDWNMLYQSMNQLYKRFPDSLRETFPQLDETEVRICCLTYAGLNNTEISLIMELSINTIQMKKSILRKKLGIEGYGNIVEFLNKNIYKHK